MRNKIIASIAACALVFGFATPASAATTNYNNCKYRYSGAVYAKMCWVDYSWFEEVFKGRTDGYETVSVGVR